jgi:hypothetical protein
MPLLIPPKKMSTILMGTMDHKRPAGEEVEESATGERDYDIALHSAGEDMINAIHSKDVKLFVQAMKDFHSIYDEEMEAEGYGAEEEEHESY